MTMKIPGKGILQYLKTRNRASLFAGVLAFLPAFAFVVFAISRMSVPVDSWVASGYPWDSSINTMLASILLNMLFFGPVIILFITGYLMLESHSLGFKISAVLAVTFVILSMYNFFNADLLLFSGFICALASMVSFQETRKTQQRRNQAVITENVARFGLRLSGFICVATLFGLIAYVALRGAQFLTLNFLIGSSVNYTQIGKVIVGLAPGTVGGIRDFIVGSLLVVGLCEAVSIPLGIGAAIFLAEYAPDNRFMSTLRFFIETLAGAPSVIIGLFGYTYFVTQFKMGYSLPAAGLSLAFMILPWNIRVAEEAMRSVPQAYREASYALGATKWQTIRSTVLLPASPGAITGVLLGVGAAIGETAVVVFTAGGAAMNLPNSISITGGSGQNIPMLSIWIYNAWKTVHAVAPAGSSIVITRTSVWEEANVAYTGALVLLIIFFVISVSALILRNYLAKKTRAS
jgi:phosphate transport system permease protein